MTASTAVAVDSPGSVVTNVEEGLQNILQNIDDNWGEFITQYSPTNAPSSTSYFGGPAMPFGMDNDFKNFVAWQTNGYPVYLGGWNGAGLPYWIMPYQGN